MCKKTIFKISFGEVYRWIYGRKSHLTARSPDNNPRFKLDPGSREMRLLSAGQIGEKTQSDREKLKRKNYKTFCQFRSKLAITHTIAIKWKEKYDSVVVDCEFVW